MILKFPYCGGFLKIQFIEIRQSMLNMEFGCKRRI